MKDFIVLLVEFISPEDYYPYYYISLKNNPYLEKFEDILVESIIKCLNKEEIKKYVKLIKEKGLEDYIEDLYFLIDFNKLNKELKKYGFYYLEADRKFTLNAWTYLTKDLKLETINGKLTKIEEKIEQKLQEKKEEILND